MVDRGLLRLGPTAVADEPRISPRRSSHWRADVMDWLIDLLPSGAAVESRLVVAGHFSAPPTGGAIGSFGASGKLAGRLWCGERTWLVGAPSLCGGWLPHCGRGGRRSGRACAWYCRHRRGRWEAWRRAAIGSLVAGVVGLFVPPPVIGAILVAMLGAFIGAFGETYFAARSKRSFRPALLAAGDEWPACSPKSCPAASWPCWWPWIL